MTTPTNHHTPVILDDAALEEIEAKRTRNEVTNRDIDALCQTVRALRTKYDAEEEDHRLTIDMFRQQERIWQQKFDEQEAENAALREQLSQVTDERQQWLSWADAVTGNKEYLVTAMRRAIGKRIVDSRGLR